MKKFIVKFQDGKEVTVLADKMIIADNGIILQEKKTTCVIPKNVGFFPLTCSVYCQGEHNSIGEVFSGLATVMNSIKELKEVQMKAKEQKEFAVVMPRFPIISFATLQ